MNPQYKSKCRERFLGLIKAKGLALHSVKEGKLGDEPCVCFIFEPGTELHDLVNDGQKCFRAAEVIKGRGASPQYAPEIIYPTAYIIFKPTWHIKKAGK